MPVLVYVEQTEGKFKKSAFEAVSFAASLAEAMHVNLVAVSIGPAESNDPIDTNSLKALGKYGATKVISVASDKLSSFVNQAYASILADVARAEKAETVVMSNSFTAKGLAPRLAIKLEAALGEGVIEMPTVEGERMEIRKAAFSGKAITTVTLNTAIKVLTLTPNAFRLIEKNGEASVEEFVPTITPSDFSTMVKEIIRNTEKVSLPDAERVVSAGRGLKGPEHWKMIEDLADALGAATACSKPVSDAGWRPHSEHVGQTGITISPNLYIAVGISGAIQHLAGVSTSKVIVVINKDPEAPFFKAADYGIVGDAFEVIPKLIEAAKALKQ